MKKYQVWRYECEFCGKKMLSGGWMGRHEKGCTANPNRICRFHKVVTGEDELIAPSVESLVKILIKHKNDEDHGLKVVREACDDCPCCILAALRQSGFCKGTNPGQEDYIEPLIGKEQFDFAKEIASAWADCNDANAERY